PAIAGTDLGQVRRAFRRIGNGKGGVEDLSFTHADVPSRRTSESLFYSADSVCVFRQKCSKNFGGAPTLRLSLEILQLLEQKRPSVSPYPISCSGRNAQGIGRLLRGEAGEETQFDQFRRFRIGGSQLVQSFVHRKDILIHPRCDETGFIKG